ncbi:hypothetical protein [Gordonia insulae]|nr:hypothetical protein [Gordonia insulae]
MAEVTMQATGRTCEKCGKGSLFIKTVKILGHGSSTPRRVNRYEMCEGNPKCSYNEPL